MKKLAQIACGIVITAMLAGCASLGTGPVVTNQYIVVADIPENLYNCPVISKFPNPDTLTNAQVAELIIKLDKNNHICKQSLNAVHKYVDDLKARAVKINGKA